MARSIALALIVLAAAAAAPASAAQTTPVRVAGQAAVPPAGPSLSLTGDGERYVSFVAAGTRTARVIDTKTGATSKVPDCQLADGSRGLFVAACGSGFGGWGGRRFYDARTRRLFKLRGAAADDTFTGVGTHWAEGEAATPCTSGNKCSFVVVYVNRKSAKRIECYYDFESCDRNLDSPDGRYPREPRIVFVDRDLSLVLRERGRGDARLAAPGICSYEAGHCNPWLAAGRVSWHETDQADGTPARVRGFDLRTRRRALWTVPRTVACPGKGTLRAFKTHTRWSVYFTGLFAYEADRYACRAAPVYAADWPRPKR